MAPITLLLAPKPSALNTVFLRAIGSAPLQTLRWLIKRVLPLTGVALLAGQFSAGKTFIGADISLSIVFDRTFVGKKVKPGGVLWVAAEGGGEIDSRVAAARAEKFRDGHVGEIPFLITEPPAGLASGNILTWLENAVAEAAFECEQRFGTHLRLVVIDTLAACFNITDEQDNAEAARLMKEFARIGNNGNVLIMPIAHHGKDSAAGVRGASAYAAGADAILAVLGATDQVTGKVNKRSLSLTKSRRGGTGPLGAFEVRSHVFGIDEDGDTDDAGYVEFLDAVEGPQAKPKPIKSKIPRDFTDAFNEALSDHGADYQISGGPLVKAVNVTEVRNGFSRRYVTGNPTLTDSARYKAFTNALTAAKTENMIAGVHLSRNVELLWALRD